MSRCQRCSGFVRFALLVLVFGFLAGGSLATQGATAANYSFPYRTNTSSFYRLHEHPNRIIVLEFYFWWCPHCQNATPRIHNDIELYYKNRGGNNYGAPVEVVYVSLEEAYPGNQDFVRTNGLELVVNDLQYTNYSNFGGGGTPHIVIINGVTNSSNTAAWSIVHTSSGYSTLNNLINTMRTRIDAIRAPNFPPTLRNPRRLSNGTFEFALSGQRGRTNVIEGSLDWSNWTSITNLISTNGTAVFRWANPVDSFRYYRARVR